MDYVFSVEYRIGEVSGAFTAIAKNATEAVAQARLAIARRCVNHTHLRKATLEIGDVYAGRA